MISSLEVEAESAPRREIDDPGSPEEWEWDVSGEWSEAPSWMRPARMGMC